MDTYSGFLGSKISSEEEDNLFSVFENIRFDPDQHRYFYGDKELHSVTKFIKESFTPKFHKEYWLKYKTLKNNNVRIYPVKEELSYVIDGKKVHFTEVEIDVSELSNQWESAKDKGLARGNRIHDYLENAWIGQKNKETIEYLDEFIKEKKKYLKPVYIEGIVADFDLGICGMTDGLFWNKKKQCYQMRDNKTDKEIKIENPYETMLYPFDFLDNTNFSKYTIQLNIYTWCIEKYIDIEIKDLFVDHFHDETYTTYIIPKLPLHEIGKDYFRTKG